MNFLLDTNIVSEVRKQQPDRRVLRWFESTPASQLYLSALVVGELRQGIERLRRHDSQRAASYDRWLDTLTEAYGDRMLPIDTEVSQVWGRLNVPDPLAVVDGLMAATAIVHSLTFVTRNVADVARTGVPVLNPFGPSALTRKRNGRDVHSSPA